jgi:hypothetical protein
MQTIAKANTIWASVWFISLIILIFYTFYSDVNGDGLADSIYYHTLGIFIYPFFYISISYGVLFFGNVLLKRKSYISHDNQFLYILGKNVGTLGLIDSVEVRENFLGLKSVYILMLNGKLIPIRGYFLNIELTEIQRILIGLKHKALLN